jgi:hypothetical protein
MLPGPGQQLLGEEAGKGAVAGEIGLPFFGFEAADEEGDDRRDAAGGDEVVEDDGQRDQVAVGRAVEDDEQRIRLSRHAESRRCVDEDRARAAEGGAAEALLSSDLARGGAGTADRPVLRRRVRQLEDGEEGFAGGRMAVRVARIDPGGGADRLPVVVGSLASRVIRAVTGARR